MCKKCNDKSSGIDRDGRLFKGKGIILTYANADNRLWTMNSKVIKNNSSVLDANGRIKE